MIKITKAKFEAYEDVRSSGITNMWNVRTVMSISGLSKEECLDIMKNYDKYNKKYPKGRGIK